MSQADNKTHVIIAEDNARDMEYLTASLDMVTCDQATDGDQAFELFKQRPNSYLITDIQLPGLNGIELSTEVWKLSPSTRIIVWSQFNDEIYLRSLSTVIPADALYGYVLKSNPSKILKRAVKSVFYEEQCWIDPLVRPIQARNRGGQISITDAEYDVLVDIALGMTDQLIAQRRFLSKRGVQSRLKTLYSKLEVDRSPVSDGINPRSRAVAIAYTRGLINQFELEKAELEFKQWQASNEFVVR